MRTAYLVGSIDMDTRTLESCAIYSEASSTSEGRTWSVVLTTVTGESYSDADAKLRKHIAGGDLDPWLGWALKVFRP